ncbi:fucolectin-like [Narcine bancroftii]|uniref:fucolectin-like n=1 Tax=Narcine bancroftii TaxID=1343680 RepID=UPI0038311D85
MKSICLLVIASLCLSLHFTSAQGNVIGGVRATQSSTSRHRGAAINAIDGNHNTNLWGSSCSQTRRQCRPWWRVDLHQHYKIFVVRITAPNSHRLSLAGAEIHIGDSLFNNGNNNTLCARISSLPPGRMMEFFCQPPSVHGRFLNIYLPRCHTTLALCEVEAFGAHDPH